MGQQNQPSRLERKLKGTPLSFAAVATRLGFFLLTHKTAEQVTGYIWTLEPPQVWPARDYATGAATVAVFTSEGNAKLDAILLPDGTTLLSLYATDEDWMHVEPAWLTLVAELERLGFIEPWAAPDNKGPRLKCNQWLVDQYFNHGRQELAKLSDEWLRIHQTVDCRPMPDNPIASMISAINEEKKRRQGT